VRWLPFNSPLSPFLSQVSWPNQPKYTFCAALASKPRQSCTATQPPPHAKLWSQHSTPASPYPAAQPSEISWSCVTGPQRMEELSSLLKSGSETLRARRQIARNDELSLISHLNFPSLSLPPLLTSILCPFVSTEMVLTPSARLPPEARWRASAQRFNTCKRPLFTAFFHGLRMILHPKRFLAKCFMHCKQNWRMEGSSGQLISNKME
jgi:hypothetical protein